MNKKKQVRFINVFLIAFLIIFNINNTVFAAMPQTTSSEGVFIYEETTDTVVFEHNSNKKKYPASTTKIMTAVVTLENVKNLNESVIIGEEMSILPAGSSTANLKRGEEIRYKDLLYGLMLPSGNDAAIVLAVNAGREMEGDKNLNYKKAYKKFVEKMNEKVKELNLSGTHFTNPHGYHDENHYSTARDMTMLGVYASKKNMYNTIVKTRGHVAITNKMTHQWYNTNDLLYPTKPGRKNVNPNYYQFTTGAKTGYTNKAQRCLVFSSVKDDYKIFGSILCAEKSRVFPFAKEALQSSNNEYTQVDMTRKGKTAFAIKVSNSAFTSLSDIKVTTKDDIRAYVKKENKDNVKIKFVPSKEILEKDSNDTYSINDRVEKKQIVGTLEVYAGGTLLKTYDAVARNDVAPAGPYDVYIENIAYITLSFCVVVVVIVGIYVTKHNKRRRKKGKKRRKVKHSTLKKKKRRYERVVEKDKKQRRSGRPKSTEKKKKPVKKIRVVYNNKKKRKYPRNKPRHESKR